MNKIMSGNQFRRWLSVLLLAAAVILIYKAVMGFDTIAAWFGAFIKIISPFLYGFIIAYVLNIPCSGIQKLLDKSKNKYIKKNKKGISIAITYVLFVLLIYVILSLLLPAIYNSIKDFIVNFDKYLGQAQAVIDNLELEGYFNIDIDLEKMLKSVSVTNIIDRLGIDNILSSISTVLSLSSSIFNIALSLITSIYFLIESETFLAFITRLFKAFIARRVYLILSKYASKINTYFRQFIFCQLIDAGIMGTWVTIVMSIAGCRYSLFLGPMLGIMNMIPYFGSIIGSVVAVIIVAFTDGFPKAIFSAVFLILSQQLDGNLVQPKLLGGSLAISPLLIIIAITIGGAVFGVMGMIIAVPIVTVLKNIVMDILDHREKYLLKREI